MLPQFIQRYTGTLRSWKGAYVLNNLWNARLLWRNRSLYRQFGLRKSVFAPIGWAHFPQHDTQNIPWLDKPDAAAALEAHPDFAAYPPEVQNSIRTFVRDGYLILPNFFPETDTHALNAEVEALLAKGEVGFNYTGRKIFNLFERSAMARDRFFKHPEVLSLLSFLLGRHVVPFQSLNFTEGSEQRAHSDSIHMTTEPPGYLIATWIALEDIAADSGPLFYYPGSHRLPWIMTPDYESGNTPYSIGSDSNRRYEDRIESLIREHNLEKKMFLPKRGDVLIWHANLLHGGSPIARAGATRRSMVCHYYAENALCYHEMSQRPALIKP